MRVRAELAHMRRIGSIRAVGLLGILLLAGCSADSDARGTPSEGRAARPEATNPAFIDAYEAGFQRGIADVRAEIEHDINGEASVDGGFPQRWQSLTGLDVPDVGTYVRSGGADAWLDTRYRDLGIVHRDLVAANTLLFLSNWEAFTGASASRAQSDGARRQIEDFLRKSALQESASEVEVRRRVYELMAATLARESRRVRGTRDEAGIAAFAQTVRADFRRLSNNDLAGFELTGEGFQER